MVEVNLREGETDVRGFFSPKRFLNSVRRLKFSLYLTLIVKALLPTIYSTVRISLLGYLIFSAPDLLKIEAIDGHTLFLLLCLNIITFCKNPECWIFPQTLIYKTTESTLPVRRSGSASSIRFCRRLWYFLFTSPSARLSMILREPPTRSRLVWWC